MLALHRSNGSKTKRCREVQRNKAPPPPRRETCGSVRPPPPSAEAPEKGHTSRARRTGGGTTGRKREPEDGAGGGEELGQQGATGTRGGAGRATGGGAWGRRRSGGSYWKRSWKRKEVRSRRTGAAIQMFHCSVLLGSSGDGSVLVLPGFNGHLATWFFDEEGVVGLGVLGVWVADPLLGVWVADPLDSVDWFQAMWCLGDTLDEVVLVTRWLHLKRQAWGVHGQTGPGRGHVCCMV
eukprot:2818983-Rhodomonas_salina.3